MHVARPCGIRVGIPLPLDLSPEPWVGEAAAARLPASLDTIRRRAEGFRLRAVFLGGSAVHGELCGLVTPEGERRVLSDLDIGVLTERRIDWETRDRITHELDRAEGAGPEARCGFYCAEDLARQAPTLGMVETARSGWVLLGSASELGRFSLPAPRQIPIWEARRLLANRLLEWIEARESADPIRSAYAGAKLVSDIAAVALIGRGLFRGGGFAARAADLREFRLLGGEALDRVARWTAWRLSPDWNRLPFEGDPVRGEGAGSLGWAVRESIAVGLDLCGEDSRASSCFSDPAVSSRVRIRSWRRWVARRAGERRFPGPGNWARTPRTLLWEAAVWFSLGRFEACRGTLDALVRTGETERAAETICRLGKTMDREGIE